MNFEEALANMKRGKMVRRAISRGIAYDITEGHFTVWHRMMDRGMESWKRGGKSGCVLAEDALANDWEVVE